MCKSKAFSRSRAGRLISKALFVSFLSGTLVACSNDFSRVSDQDYTAAVSAQRDFLGQPTRQPMPAVPIAGSSSNNVVARQNLQPVQPYPAQQAYPNQQAYIVQPAYPVQQTYSSVQPTVDYTQPAASAAPAYRPTPSSMAKGDYQVPKTRQADPIVTAAVGQDESGWTRNGGQTVTIKPGDTLYGISRRHNVPEQAILNANGLSGPRDIVAGRYLTIPTFVRAQTQQAAVRTAQPQLQAFPQKVSKPAQQAAPQAAARAAVVNAVRSVGSAPRPSSKPATQAVVTRPAVVPATVSGGSYRVAPGDTLYGIARRHNVNVGALSAANNLGQSTNIKIGQTLVIPGHGQASTVSAGRTVAPNTVAPNRTAQLAPRNVQTTGSIQPPKPVAVKQVQPVVYTPPKAEQQEPAKQAGSGNLSFRWPVRGRVISTFGDKTNGERNDGINLAVPDGTPVKAAEDGVVIYSGNELKSYGNLVLVRHSGGWVTAYAHNRGLSVNRGDQVRRGQEIAQAGATGSVSSPQLRFELRKGSTPVNPLDHLGGV